VGHTQTSILSFTCVTFLSILLQITVNTYSEQDCLCGALGIATALRSGVRISVGARGISLLQNVQPGTEAHPASYSMDTKARLGRLMITTHLSLVPGLRMSEAISLLTILLWLLLSD
jgi:hypothetical protein